jgi:hypothetical protein
LRDFVDGGVSFAEINLLLIAVVIATVTVIAAVRVLGIVRPLLAVARVVVAATAVQIVERKMVVVVGITRVVVVVAVPKVAAVVVTEVLLRGGLLIDGVGVSRGDDSPVGVSHGGARALLAERKIIIIQAPIGKTVLVVAAGVIAVIRIDIARNNGLS